MQMLSLVVKMMVVQLWNGHHQRTRDPMTERVMVKATALRCLPSLRSDIAVVGDMAQQGESAYAGDMRRVTLRHPQHCHRFPQQTRCLPQLMVLHNLRKTVLRHCNTGLIHSCSASMLSTTSSCKSRLLSIPLGNQSRRCIPDLQRQSHN